MECPDYFSILQLIARTHLGYRIVGSHSGVKLCRWTKSMLRGRGGCYKHTFYGIESHRCMETTPSLACANKCVFCWRYVEWEGVAGPLPFPLAMMFCFHRHHTNPVGTEWRWKMDDPHTILKGALENHYQMVKQFKGKVLEIFGVLVQSLNQQHSKVKFSGFLSKFSCSNQQHAHLKNFHLNLLYL